MKNQAFTTSSLARCLYPIDFYRNKELSDDHYRNIVLLKALTIVEQSPNMPMIKLRNIMIGKKQAYSTTTFEEKIILRKCASNIKDNIQIKPKNRNIISRELKIYLKEGTPYRIYKLDIKSFYESIPSDYIRSKINELKTLSTHTKNILLNHLNFFHQHFNTSGVPRGIETSSLLAEISLQEFDSHIKSHSEVFYFSRFVDDILIITSSKENEIEFETWIKNKLPLGLSFNNKKNNVLSIEKQTSGGSHILSFDFLGYTYRIKDNPSCTAAGLAKSIYRVVEIDISENKVKKIKEKICKSFFSYYKNSDFNLLVDRLLFLTTNRLLIDKNTKRNIPTGIYYNYSTIDNPSASLIELDTFLKKLITAKSGRLANLYKNKFDLGQRKTLLKISFSDGFNGKLHKKFSPNRLKTITGIWL